ncbi:MAG: DUF2799 domain-containing protein [Gammaproteobacteria bacterium]|nr:DUF2799 domain-containing protein [Gammaproteobacteria bacterium]
MSITHDLAASPTALPHPLIPGQRRHWRVLPLVLAAVVLTGCATLDKSECLRGDWITVGYDDGKRGYDPEQQLKRHTKACSKHSVAPDVVLYQQGYTQGLAKFCTSGNGYEYATNKNEYRGVCPEETQNAFLEGYTSGLKTLIDRINVDIDEYDDEKDDARLDLVILSSNQDADPNSVKKARERLDYYDSQLSSARSERQKFRRWLDRWMGELK